MDHYTFMANERLFRDSQWKPKPKKRKAKPDPRLAELIAAAEQALDRIQGAAPATESRLRAALAAYREVPS